MKNIIKETICKSEVYKEKLQNREWDKCWTLEYAKVNGIGFNIDIVPGVSESNDVVQSMINLGVSRENAELAVAITDKRGENYFLFSSNPRAYKNWFETINKPFLYFNRDNR